MIKDPKQFAEQMLAMYFGNKENALIELYNTARAYTNVPCRFFYDVANIIRESDGHEEGYEPPDFEDDGRSQEAENDRYATRNFKD